MVYFVPKTLDLPQEGSGQSNNNRDSDCYSVLSVSQTHLLRKTKKITVPALGVILASYIDY